MRAASVGRTRLRQAGRQRLEFVADRNQVGFVARHVTGQLADRGAQLRQFRALPLAHLAGVLNLLLVARNLGAQGVITALHLANAFAGFDLKLPLGFQRRFAGAQFGQRRLQRDIALAHR